MPVARVNGIELYYEERGSGEPLLLVMGLGADHLAWFLQVPTFARHHRTIVFDNRDVGRSTHLEAHYTVDDLVADTLGLADALGLDRFHLLGLSMGSAIAQHAALAAPERILTLTLAATWAGASRAYSRAKAANWERELRHASREEFFEAMLLLTMSERFYDTPGAVENARRLMRQNPYPQPAEAFLRQARALAEHDLRDRLGELTMPVHVISGEHDILIPAFKQAEAAALIPGAELTTIPAAPHAMHMENPREFNSAVLDFIARHARVGSAPAGG